MSNEKKQSSVEWLVEQLTPAIALQQKYIDEIKEQATEMHREEIVDALKSNVAMYIGGPTEKEIEEYYNETFNQ
jgi:hypothetical protein